MIHSSNSFFSPCFPLVRPKTKEQIALVALLKSGTRMIRSCPSQKSKSEFPTLPTVHFLLVHSIYRPHSFRLTHLSSSRNERSFFALKNRAAKSRIYIPLFQSVNQGSTKGDKWSCEQKIRHFPSV